MVARCGVGWQILWGENLVRSFVGVVEKGLIREVTRSGGKNTVIVHEGPLRTTKNISFYPQRQAKGREGHRRTPFFGDYILRKPISSPFIHWRQRPVDNA